jgi:hypothetical protein
MCFKKRRTYGLLEYKSFLHKYHGKIYENLYENIPIKIFFKKIREPAMNHWSFSASKGKLRKGAEALFVKNAVSFQGH